MLVTARGHSSIETLRIRTVDPTMSLAPIALLIALATITPGPNNLVLMQAGIDRAQKSEAFRLCLAIVLGGSTLFILAWAGMTLANSFSAQAAKWLGLSGALVLFYMAWHSWRRAEAPNGGSASTPMRFWGMFLFQFANPKAWAFMAALGTLVLETLTPVRTGVTVVALFAAISALSCLIWLMAGQLLAKWMSLPSRASALNRVFAFLLFITALIQLWETLS